MTISISDQEYDLMSRYIQELCGISLGREKAYLIENRLSNLVLETGCSTFGEFYRKIRNDPRAGSLRDTLVDAIATKETLWFRDANHFEILKNVLFPRLKAEIDRGMRDRIAIWSAACATGQEPYSIAMAAREFFRGPACEKDYSRYIRITATDVSRSCLEIAQQGLYTDTAIRRGMAPAFLLRYFHKQKNQWQIDDKIREMVGFRQYNLMEPPPRTFGSFDLVFLRNVIIYFSENVKKRLFKKLAGLMSPRGCLFLGTGETVNGHSDVFEMVEAHGGVYYKLRL